MIYLAIALFAVTYVLMLVFSKYSPYIALVSSHIFFGSGMLPLGKVFGSTWSLQPPLAWY